MDKKAIPNFFTKNPYLALIPAVVLILLWKVPPGQDLPQHLAMGKILLDYKVNPQFQNFYQLPNSFQSYHSLYYLLSFMGKLFGIPLAFKIIHLIWCWLILFSFQVLRRRIQGIKNVKLEIALFYLTLFNGAFSMGFYSFWMTIPFFLLATKEIVDIIEKPHDWRPYLLIGLYSLLISLLHLVGLGALFLLILCFIFFYPKKTLKLIPLLAVQILFAFYISGVGKGAAGDLSKFDIAGSFYGTFGLEFINSLFKINWSNLISTTNYLTWNLIGPYSRPLITPIIILYLGGLYYMRCKKKRLTNRTRATAPLLLFFIISILLPWGIYRPSEVTFLNFRLMGVALILFWALFREEFWNDKITRRIILSFTFVSFLGHSLASLNLQKEAEAPLSLMKEIPKQETMLSLVFHDESYFYGKMFRLTHFLPMYFTINHGGIATQFWARYTSHLPIAYKDGKKPNTPADWHPWKLTEKQLQGFNYILIQGVPKEREPSTKMRHFKIKKIVEKSSNLIRCQELWCLYKKIGH